jgi:hypothetical protein
VVIVLAMQGDIFFFAMLRFELRAYILSHSTSPFLFFCDFFFVFLDRSRELFAQADLEQ